MQQTSGVFVISDLQKEMDWREACILSDMLLKSYMSATQHNPLELHPGVDLEKGEGFSTSELAIQKLKFFHPHRDRGLFNVVLGSRSAFRALFIQFGANNRVFGVIPSVPSVYELTAGWDDDALLAVVIPGYSLHLFEPRVPSLTHWVHHTDNTDRVTQVFRCRLRPDFVVAGTQIGLAIQSIEHSPEASRRGSLAASQVRFD